ncbi:MAG: CHASE3 domain-containing protein, partial [Rhodospirillaceae bacterium]|nr:CHASE3 domain-containing protein [Rhodospirillaceae bacterium]
MKFSNLKTKPKILIGICSPLVLLLILGGISIFNINSIVDTNERVEHTQNVLGKAADIIGSAVDMETGMRGYLLAGKEDFLAPYKGGEEATYKRIKELQGIVSDNPKQVARLGNAEKTLRDWQAKVTEPTIGLRREIGDAATMNDMSKIVGEARGKKFFDKFRGQIETFISRESALLEKRQAVLKNNQGAISKELTETIGWITHTYQVILQANAILAAAVDMETGMRGYLLAGKEGFLAPYNGGADQFSKLTTALKKTVSDNPAQVKLLTETQANIQAWRKEVVDPVISLRRKIGNSKTMDDMADLIGEARGKKFFDGFRKLMADFSNEEIGLMDVRRAANVSTVSSTFTIIALTLALGLVIGLGLAWFIGNSIANPIKKITDVMGELAGGRNEVEIPSLENGDEIG